MRRRLFKALTGMVVATAVLLMTLTSGRVSEALRLPLVGFASRLLGQPVTLSRLQLVAFPPGVVLHEVTVGALATPEGEQTPLYVSAGRVRLRPHWSSALLGRLVLRELLVEDLALEARIADTPEGPQGQQSAASLPPADDAAAAKKARLARAALQDKLTSPVDVHTLSVHNARATLTAPNWQLRLPAVEVEGAWRGIGRRALSVHVEQAALAHSNVARGEPLLFDASLAANLDGSWARPRHLGVQQANLRVPALGVTADLRGELPLAQAPAKDGLDLHLQAAVGVAALGQTLGVSVGGDASVQATLAGSYLAPQLRIAVDGSGLQRTATPTAASLATGLCANLRADVTEGAVRLQRLTVGPTCDGRHGALVQGRYVAGEFLGNLALEDVDLAGLFYAAGAPPPNWRGKVDGVVGLRADAHQRAITARLELGLREAALLGQPPPPKPHRKSRSSTRKTGQASAPAPAPTPAPQPTILAVDALGVTGTIAATADAIRLEAVELHRRGATVHVEGTVAPAQRLQGAALVGPPSPWQLGLRIWTGGLPLGSLGPIAGVLYEGVAGVAGSLQGPLSSPTVEAALDVDHLRIAQISLGHGRGVLRFAAPTLTLLDFDANRAGGTAQGEGAITFRPQDNRVRAELHLRDWDLAELAMDLQAPAAVAEQIDGRLWGDVALFGPLARPQGAARLRLPHLSVGPVDLGPTVLQASFADGPTRLALALRPQPAGGSLAADVVLADGPGEADDFKETDEKGSGQQGDGGGAADNDRHSNDLQLRLAVAGDGLPLAQLVQGDAGAVAGTLALRLDLAGPPKALEGALVADVAQLQVAGANLGGLHVVGRAADQNATLDVHLLQGSAALTAKLALKAPYTVDATATFTDLDGRAVLPLFVRAPGRWAADLVARLTAKAHLRGPLADADALTVQVHLQQLVAGLGATRLRLTQPATLRLARGRLTLPPTTLSADGTQVVLGGQIPLAKGAAVDLQTDIKGDLHSLRGLMQDVSQAQGPLQAHVHLRGPLPRPDVLGEIVLRRASLRLVDAPIQTVDNLNLRAIFSGRAVAITEGRAQVGRGNVRFGGELALARATGQGAAAASPSAAAAGTGDNINFRLRLDQVVLTPAPEFSAMATGNLELGGNLAAPQLRGDLLVQALRYTARLDLAALVPKKAAPPLRAPFSPFGRPVRLAVKVHAPGDLVLSSKVLEAELAADLMVSGTSERVGLLGSVTPLWAKARFNDNLFTLTHATIDFTDEFRLSPSYSVQAHTRACRMEADVLVQGDVDGYSVQTTGRDERGSVDPQDVLACLNFGLRLSDFNGNRKHSAGISDALSGSLDALWSVSGLDDKLRKLLPVGVDELRLTSGWSSLSQRTTARVLVGKELGPKLAMRYSRSLEPGDNSQAFTLDYRLRQQATLQLSWLSALNVPMGDFGLDMRLHWELR